MKTNYLLPNRFKKIGWILFIPGIILGAIFLALDKIEPGFLNINVFAIVEGEFFDGGSQFFTTPKNNIMDEIIALLLIVGSIFIALSKEKNEDEFISRIRLESLVWATYVNYFILILTILFVFDLAFLWVMVFNMFTILFFFMIRFNWIIYKSKKSIKDEE
jgi:hypothetical protein